jgi:hypothetical protein
MPHKQLLRACVCKRLFEFCGEVSRGKRAISKNARIFVLLAALLRAPAAACVCAVQG